MSGFIEPWSSKRRHWRLGLTIGNHFPAVAERGKAPMGWTALNISPGVIASGAVGMDELPIDAIQMTSAEYRLLRLDCGLSQAEAAGMHGVALRTVKAWESGAAEPGIEACTRLAALRASMDASALRALDLYREQTKSMGSAPQDVVLYIYSGQDYPSARACEEGLPHGAHTRLVAITADLLADQGIAVAIRHTPR